MVWSTTCESALRPKKKSIALEMLLPRGKKLNHLKAVLAGVYDTTVSEVGARFHLGRLAGLRDRIVHHGALRHVDPIILEFLGALYLDVLLALLALPEEHRAARLQQSSGEFLVEMLGRSVRDA